MKILLIATGGAAAAAVGFRGPVRDLFHRLAYPALDETPTGPLNDQALKTLLATTEALVGYPVEKDHYEDFFRWHSENLRGHKALYEQFTAIVNHSAMRSRGCAFAECEKAMRRRILDTAFQVRRAHGRLNRLQVEILHRDWLLFDQYIVRPTSSLFANTDAWRLVGYDAWPGTPQGLERYTQPPSGKVK